MRTGKAGLAILGFFAAVIGIPLTGGLILLVPPIIWLVVTIRRRNQAAYDLQVRRQAIEDDAAYGRRMRGY